MKTNEPAKKETAAQKPAEFGTTLTKVNDMYFPLIQKQLEGKGVLMDGYSKQCVLNAISAINTTLNSAGIKWTDPQLDQSSLTEILMRVASLKLNSSASPKEIYFQTRNVKSKDDAGKDIWKKQIEMGIEGDGNDSILSRFGRGVKKVCQFWLVKEGDAFEYPQYVGLDMNPPKWTPTGKGEVAKVVYPIIKEDNTVEYYIAEREDVAKNLIAHMRNNLMSETFGIAESRFKATPDQKKKIDAKKQEILKKAEGLGLASLDDADLQEWISPAWTEFQSREQMIIRKMRNNIVKKIPKDFGNAYVELTYDMTTDETFARSAKQITEHANGEVIDVVEPEEPKAETPPAHPQQLFDGEGPGF